MRGMGCGIPAGALVYDYMLDLPSRRWVLWEASLPQTLTLPADVPLQQVVVPTVDVVRPCVYTCSVAMPLNATIACCYHVY